MRDVIYHNDPGDPLFGQTTVVEHPDPPPPPPRIYTKSAFKEFCYGVLGALVAPAGTDDQKLLAGIAAFGAINRAMHAADVSDTVYQVCDEYDKADTFEKAKTLKLLGVLNAPSPPIVSTAQLAALAANWQNGN